jgi:hypothetical protein
MDRSVFGRRGGAREIQDDSVDGRDGKSGECPIARRGLGSDTRKDKRAAVHLQYRIYLGTVWRGDGGAEKESGEVSGCGPGAMVVGVGAFGGLEAHIAGQKTHPKQPGIYPI